MRSACWLAKAIVTHSEYVILTASSGQQWFCERLSVLSRKYITCLVLKWIRVTTLQKHFYSVSLRNRIEINTLKLLCWHTELLCWHTESAQFTGDQSGKQDKPQPTSLKTNGPTKPRFNHISTGTDLNSAALTAAVTFWRRRLWYSRLWIGSFHKTAQNSVFPKISQ
jgi:hypothetical protein